MGYRSEVAFMLYGDPEKVDMVDNMLTQKLTEGDQEYFDGCKQVKDRTFTDPSDNVEYIERELLWTFNDVKWYSDLQAYQSDVFGWVAQMNSEETEENMKGKLGISCEFVRIGENSDDNEEEYSEHADCRMCITRNIRLPDNFNWRE